MDNLKAFIIFISIVLLIYGSVNYYVYRRIITAISLAGITLLLIKLTLLFFIISFPLGRSIGPGSSIGQIFIWIGSFWLGIMSYAFLTLVFIDLINLTDLLTGWFPNIITRDRILTGRIILALFSFVILFLMVAGHVRQRNVEVRELSYKLENYHNPDGKEYTLVVFSDTHLGAINRDKWLGRLIGQINANAPDAVLIVGDLIDESPKHLGWAVEPLKKIKAPDGVWAVTGNHEFYANVDKFIAMASEANIKVLRDETTELGGLFIIGLDDFTVQQQFGVTQPPIKDLLTANTNNLPSILLNHTPKRYREAAEAGVDLMFSGHTHAGQMWPFGYIAKLTYGIGQGFSWVGGMKYFLTNGAGTWGPPVRVGTTPELLIVRIR